MYHFRQTDEDDRDYDGLRFFTGLKNGLLISVGIYAALVLIAWLMLRGFG